MNARGAVLPPLPDDVAVPEIDRCVRKRLQEKRFSAAACVASVGWRVFHRVVYGCPVMPPPLRRLDATALFDLASLSKPLGAGLAALYLVGRGRLDLDARISQVLRAFRDSRFANISVDMLLDHTAGFAAIPDFWDKLRDDDMRLHPQSRVLGTARSRELIEASVAAMPLVAEPGSGVVYSDVGFMVLGWVIEEVVGKPLDVFLASEIFEPLGLASDLFFVRCDDGKQRRELARRTFVATEQCARRGRLVQGEVHDYGAWAMGGVAGHAGLFATADAVWRLCRTLLACYEGDTRGVVVTGSAGAGAGAAGQAGAGAAAGAQTGAAAGAQIGAGAGMGATTAAASSLFHSATLKRFWTRSRRVGSTTRALAWDTPNALESSAGQRFSRSSVGHLGFTGTSVWIDLSTRIIGVVLCNAVHPTEQGAREALREFRPRIYDLIASSGDAIGRADKDSKRGRRRG